jgi:hypothetical protein
LASLKGGGESFQRFVSGLVIPRPLAVSLACLALNSPIRVPVIPEILNKGLFS